MRLILFCGYIEIFFDFQNLQSKVKIQYILYFYIIHIIFIFIIIYLFSQFSLYSILINENYTFLNLNLINHQYLLILNLNFLSFFTSTFSCHRKGNSIKVETS